MVGEKKLCYVIMPYGKKHVGGLRFIDFEKVYSTIIERSRQFIDGHELEFRRSKDEKKAGGITAEFINNILGAEIAIIDVSSGNANVFYELGMRHAFRKRISVMIAHASTKLPFDIQDMRTIFYDHRTERGQVEAAKDIAAYIRGAMNSSDADSPVYRMVPNYSVRVEHKPCPRKLTYEYQIRRLRERFIGVMAGNLTEVRDVDVWVNAENTDMEMARMCDSSVSGIIRYFGSARGVDGRPTEDLIQGYLWKEIDRGRGVLASTVVATEPGRLGSWGVRKLLHVAAFRGEPGKGYEPVKDLDGCITRALDKLHELNAPEDGVPALRSVLFPIFGTGRHAADQDKVLFQLVTAACRYLRQNPNCVERVYFQAYTEEELRLTRDVLSAHPELEQLDDRALDPVWTSPEGVSKPVHVEGALIKLRELKVKAKQLRSDKDMKGAIKMLEEGMQEGRNALAISVNNADLAEEVADCIGMLGGNLSREGRMSEARAAYQAGRDIEMNVPGVTLTYNTVNLLVARLLDDGWAALECAKPDIREVRARLKARVARGDGDLWTWADLGMCEFLGLDFDAARQSYGRAAELAGASEQKSMLSKLLEIEGRWPEPDGPKKGFYSWAKSAFSGVPRR